MAAQRRQQLQTPPVSCAGFPAVRLAARNPAIPLATIATSLAARVLSRVRVPRSRSARRIGSILLLTLFLLALAAAGQSPSTGALYKISAGPHNVEETREMALRDAPRNKDLQVRIHYPAEDGSYPVIAFSHGAGGSKECCSELARHWASHGYVVIQMTHADSLRLRREQGDRTPAAQALAGAVRQLGRPENRQGRTDDVKFVLDSLGEIEKRIPALKGKLDSTRIGAGGHSAGALTSQLLGGAKIFGSK